ncbi:hypothetical protein ACJMK2_012300 [Sinanodonta woodiana]|uniref:Uncharacterized protein n=1 Tax=Sinanodonta woodiana TaxID=1069815 RepID=A0ABD3VAN9_SINWO
MGFSPGLGLSLLSRAVYIYDCSLQSMIPISMIVSGLLPVFLIVSGNRNKKESKFTGFLCGLIALLLNIVWTVAESAWVYPAWDTWKSRGNVSCAASEMNCKSCNEALLKFAVAMVTLDWIFLAIITTYIFCVVYTQLSL